MKAQTVPDSRGSSPGVTPSVLQQLGFAIVTPPSGRHPEALPAWPWSSLVIEFPELRIPRS